MNFLAILGALSMFWSGVESGSGPAGAIAGLSVLFALWLGELLAHRLIASSKILNRWSRSLSRPTLLRATVQAIASMADGS